LIGRTYQARVSALGVAEPVESNLNYTASGGGSGQANGFPFVGALSDLGYPSDALMQGVPLVRERQIDDPPLPPGLAALVTQVAPGWERSEMTLLGVEGTGADTVAHVVERVTGRSPTRRRSSGEEYGGTFDVSAEFDVVLVNGLTRQARITTRGESTSPAPLSPSRQPSTSLMSTEYRLLDGSA